MDYNNQAFKQVGTYDILDILQLHCQRNAKAELQRYTHRFSMREELASL